MVAKVVQVLRAGGAARGQSVGVHTALGWFETSCHCCIMTDAPACLLACLLACIWVERWTGRWPRAG